MNPDLDALATRLYVTIDDALKAHPHWVPERPEIGITPKLCDAELVTLAVIQALLGYNKRLRRSGELLTHVNGFLARQCPSYSDNLWLVDSTPVECGRSRETAKRSDLAGWAQYGYCASHSRYFWGLRLHMIATPSGLPIAFALTGAKADERETCLEMLHHADLDTAGRVLIADKGYRSAEFETDINTGGMTLIRPATRSEKPRPGQQALHAWRQTIESIFDTLKDQLGLERHGARTRPGVAVRVQQRILALTAAIWHNETTQRHGPARSLIAYDH